MRTIQVPESGAACLSVQVHARTDQTFREAVHLALISLDRSATMKPGEDADAGHVWLTIKADGEDYTVFPPQGSDFQARRALVAEFADFPEPAAQIIADNAAKSEHFANVTRIHGTAYPEARPDWDDLTPEERLSHAMHCIGTCEFGEEAHGGPEASA